MSASKQKHAEPKHDFHLVDPSPLPIVATFTLASLAVSALLFMHEKPYGNIALPMAFALVALVLYFWWKKVIDEGLKDKAHTSVVQQGLRIGMVLFIMSEVMFFFGFFFAFFMSSLLPANILDSDGLWAIAAGVWPPEGIETFDPWSVPFLNTLILLLSGTTVTWAHHALLHEDRAGLIKGLTWTVILGLLFTSLQAYEYHHAIFGFKDGIYPSTFYMATGFHGFHVIVGTIFLFVCLRRAKKGQLTPDAHLGFEFAAWYWHFVDVVWLFLFTWIYVWGS